MDKSLVARFYGSLCIIRVCCIIVSCVYRVA